MVRRCPSITSVFPLLAILGVPACGGGDVTTPSTTGSLEVTTSTTGAESDLDGYTVQLDAGSPQVVGSASVLRISDIAAGSHAIQLADVAGNCTVLGDNPRTISIMAGEVATVTFAVACSASTGSLELASATTGPAPDADGYTVTLDGVDRGPLGVSAGVALTGLAPGSHMVGLSGVAANCQVQGENPRAAMITAGASTTVAFAVTCAEPPPQAGTLRITTVTTGPDPDPDGYAFAIDGGSSQPIGVNGEATLPGVAPAGHTIRLSGVASNCAVAGTNPRAVAVSGGSTADVSFAVGCTTSRAGTPSASKSRVTASPSSMNLQGISEVTVTVRDGNGTPLSGVPVTLTSSGAANTISPSSRPSGADGKASFHYSSTTAETKTITATAGTVEITQTATVTITKVASTVVIMSNNPDRSVVGQPVRVTFFVTAGNQAPTGDVTITVSGGPETCTVTLQFGVGACDVVFLAPGTGADNQRAITATYSGDASCAAASVAEAHRVDASIFDLVSVRDHIPGSFTVPRSLYADRDRIYLGSAQGGLFVLAAIGPLTSLWSRRSSWVRRSRAFGATRNACMCRPPVACGSS